MRRSRKVKILATLGPASSDKATIASLFRAGADLFRINMSHTDHDMLRRLVDHDPRGRGRDRPADRHPRRPAGPEAPHRRLRRAHGHADARPDVHARFRPDAGRRNARRASPSGNSSPRSTRATACSSTTARCASASPNARQHRAVTSVEVGTALSNRKGVSVPDTVIDFAALTAKDRSDLDAALNCRRRLDRAVLHPAAGGSRRGHARSPAAAPACSPRSRSRRRSSASPRSSNRPTR